ncbi:DUF5060 domain-containing protein [Candidatus Poribacteria bacterium]|nr:DUF5060 domain-containing protein [Candidatus Poribacteria bacterium]MBT5531852.1 DUF5060 domain-containing protein [Candidatus Poribacteria bacterium]MBT5711389.1 DUF5060 domain-containing protein [Candidatus Poribacteria bacterium]MBT7098249.1 DUF5060 domain-containing protein [Candidatus Poribacteria bacterium]MBT7806842.1 DUF5060 domain-containing protein [Candidatus Poribacteria bacterium]
MSRRHRLTAAIAGCAAIVCSSWAWEATEGGFVLDTTPFPVRYGEPGRITVGSPDGPHIDIAVFLWHGSWIHERLESGTVTVGPRLTHDGRIAESGTWVGREGAPPMTYSLTVSEAAEGATMALETTKTGDLALVSGIWCVVWLDLEDFTQDQRMLALPSDGGALGKLINGITDGLLIELEPGRAVRLQGDGARQLRTRREGDRLRWEWNLTPDDFPAGQPITTSLNIGFDTMPDMLPSEVAPQREPLAIRAVEPAAGSIAQFRTLDLVVDMSATWDNPYDPDDVALDAHVVTASGRSFTVPGFYMVPHARSVRDGAEFMSPVGPGEWHVRITPAEPGELVVELAGTDRSGSVRRTLETWDVSPTSDHGFLRASRADPRYLQFDNGDGFFPIGHNVPIYHSTGQLAEESIRKMAANGENYNRWWMSSSGLGIEWEGELGWYRQAHAARLDDMLGLAAELGFYYMLCMDTHQDFREGGWLNNPFNAVNGGPSETAGDWFTDEVAREHYRKRLRYTVARWGHSPHVLAWEFGNEFEGWADTDFEAQIPWHREMASYLDRLDPYGHLITTSWWSTTGPEAIWQIPEIDIVQTHTYTNDDVGVASRVRAYALRQWESYAKPHIFGEFGIRSHGTTADLDPEGWALHNANWAALASGVSGIAMPWWHESYIDPLDLYFHFGSMATFAADLPFGSAAWAQLAPVEVAYADPAPAIPARDVVIGPSRRWGRASQSEYVIQADGSVQGDPVISDLLHGDAHTDLRNPPTFVVDYPAPGEFIVRVGRVSAHGDLTIRVGDEVALQRAFPCGEGLGKQSEHRPQWDLWESKYDEDVRVSLPAGRHRISVENTGRDWMQITRYVFTGARVMSRPDLLVAGLRSSDVAIAWLHNRESTWHSHENGAVPLVPASVVVLEGFDDGVYRVEWHDTWRSRLSRVETVEAANGRVTLLAPEIATDVAVKIRRQADSR